MPTSSTTTKSLTLTPRAIEAVWRAVETLDATDPKRLAAAMVEAASDEAERNATFARHVKLVYDSLAPQRKTAPKPKGAKSLPAHIQPIKHIAGRPFDIGAPPDPYFLLELFGADQLRDVLTVYSNDGLLQAVEIVQEQSPDTKPKGKTKAALITYLMQQVAPGK